MQNHILLHDHLEKYFGFTEFRGPQLEVIENLLEGKDSLLLMPTGMGKSLCFQLPALVWQSAQQKKMVLVISPLIALMEDQVQRAKKVGINADYLSSTQHSHERDSIHKKLAQGAYSLFYVTPERFRKEEFLNAIKMSPKAVGLFVVDEAHCISLWGHDFRPDYSLLGERRKQLGNPPCLALTATATPQVQKDILEQLSLVPQKIYFGGIERPNLSLNVHSVYGIDEKIRWLVGYRFHRAGPIIVYFSLIQTLEKVALELEKLQIPVLKYHGQLKRDQRMRAQREFQSSDSDIMLATPAFGLGVDKANVRGVVHFEIPSSIESYYQEVGRAGRDGIESEGHLLWDGDDVSISMDFIKWSYPEPSFVKKVYQLVKDNQVRFRQEGNEYLRDQMNFYNSRDFRVETSLNQLERAGAYDSVSQKIIGEFPEQDFQEAWHKEQMKHQHEKLLSIVQWAKMKKGCRLFKIYEYFGVKLNTEKLEKVAKNNKNLNDDPSELSKASEYSEASDTCVNDELSIESKEVDTAVTNENSTDQIDVVAVEALVKRCGICDHCKLKLAKAAVQNTNP